ncbi:uncharacterized protein LOC125188754 isoform X4 [Salvia hispanica]|uniref:uncharacterized protein LOC125188754 isoform X4 n=1 Tax=Salvia hispanica TaxID=49212 RepID=UPI002009AD7F|nr:uncharacterized protein LOC125188754 isoform X4 [Salvia hispanica]
MSSKQTKARVANAFRAMKDIGISEAMVKPVLKNLLKLYDKNWELIEEENYRALADAIFEGQEAEASECSKKKTNAEERLEQQAQAAEESTQPLKRARLRYQDGQSTSSAAATDSGPTMPLIIPKDEPTEPPNIRSPEVNASQGLVLSPQPSAENRRRTDPQLLGKVKGKQPAYSESLVVHEVCDPCQPNSATSPSHAMKLRDRGKQSICPQTSSGDKILFPQGSPQATHKEWKVVRGCVPAPKKKRASNFALIIPKEEPVTDDMPQLVLPVAIIGPDDGSHLEEMNGGDGHATHTENKERHVEETNGLSSVVADHSVTPEIIKPLHDLFDIAKGQEKVIISLVNEVNSESLPSFYYIRENVVFQSASVNFSLSHIGDSSCSACSGNCLSSSAPCACAHLVRGEFAYATDGLVKDGLLKECISMKRDLKKQNQFFCKECPLERSKSDDTPEPCKGHLVRKFIKECWLRCGCNKQCGNRVVQRGITRNIQVFMTPEGKGWGLRTLEDLPEGAFVCEFVGEVLTNSEFFGRILRSTKQEKYSYPMVLDAHWGAKESLKNEEALCLDASNYGNVARFINHRCYDSNLVEIPVKVETSDHHYYRLALFTARKITVMEELTWDYAIDFDDHDHPVKAFHCQCGSKFCRNIRRSRSRA